MSLKFDFDTKPYIYLIKEIKSNYNELKHSKTSINKRISIHRRQIKLLKELDSLQPKIICA